MAAPCSISASLALIAIVSMIYMNNATQSSQVIQQYQKQLPPNLQSLYQKIATERLHIYYMGYILGFLLSLIIIFYNRQMHPRQQMSLLTITTIVVAVSFITNYFYYILSPKSAWMLDNITTVDQNKAWLKMYRHMQVYYHSGLVLGIVAVALVSIAFRQQ
jgi:predicted PurR-regulated permease PerM